MNYDSIKQEANADEARFDEGNWEQLLNGLNLTELKSLLVSVEGKIDNIRVSKRNTKKLPDEIFEKLVEVAKFLLKPERFYWNIDRLEFVFTLYFTKSSIYNTWCIEPDIVIKCTNGPFWLNEALDGSEYRKEDLEREKTNIRFNNDYLIEILAKMDAMGEKMATFKNNVKILAEEYDLLESAILDGVSDADDLVEYNPNKEEEEEEE